MIYKNDAYVSKDFPFPDEYDPDKKDIIHCIKTAQAIYSLFINDECGLYYTDQMQYSTLRQYGSGDQPEEIYKKYWLGEKENKDMGESTISTSSDGKQIAWMDSPSARRRGYMNVLWKVISIAPKVKAALVGKFQRAEFDIVANAIDSFSGAETENEKFKLMFIKDNYQFLKRFYKKAGVPFQEPEFIPENKRELDLFEEYGGFKHSYSKEIEKVVAHTLDISDFPGIKDKMMADAIDIGVFGCREYFDEEENKYKVGYVDVENAIVQYSRYYDFRDSEFAGHKEDITISELRKNLDRDNVSYKEEDIADIAKDFSDYTSNPKSDEWEKYGKPLEGIAGYGYDFYKVPILHCEWIELDNDQKLIHTNKHKKKKVIKQKLGFKNKDNENNKTIITTERYKYQCSWVIGSDKLAYNFGIAYDILRPNRKTVALSYHFYKLPTKSITDQLIPLYDNFMNLWVKYQGALSKAINRGYIINVSSIGNISVTKDGVQGGTEEEALKRFIQSGFMFFKETNAMATRNSSLKPVYDLPGGMGELFVEIQAGFQQNIQMIEHLTGVSPLALGSVDPDAPVGTSELSYQNTQDTLRPILNGYSVVKERLGSNVVSWVQLKLKNEKDNPEVWEAYEKVIGKNGVRILKLAEGKHVKYGISVEAQPTDVERKEIYEAAKVSLANGRNGKAGINQSDMFIIMHILTSGGSLKQAEMILSDRERKSEEKIDRLAKENMNMQQDYALMTEDIKQKGIINKINAQKLADIEVAYAEAVFKAMVENPEEQMRQKEILELQTFYDMMKQKLLDEAAAGQQPATNTPDKVTQTAV